MPLTVAPTGITLKVIRLAVEGKTKTYLESLGIALNSQLTVVSSGSSVVCLVKGVKLALDGQLCSKIFVTPYRDCASSDVVCLFGK